MEMGRVEAVVIGVVIVAFIAAAGASTFYGSRAHSQVTLANRSVEAISHVQLRQGDRETTLGQIEPGDMRSADFMSRVGPLTLTVTFSSGRTLSADDVGYVAPATPVTVFFNITDDKIALVYVVNRNPSSGYSKR
jgi:hypothetical protein